MNHLIISETAIRTDAQGRYCLNDLHRAAGGETRHRPATWLQNQQTQALAAEIEKDGIPSIRATRGIGTFVAKELVYAYATWISAAFHLKVIRAYDSLVSQPQTGIVLPTVQAETFLLQSAASMLRLSETSILRGLHLIASNHGIQSNYLPAYSTETLTRALGDLLKEHGSSLSAVRANPILQAMGYLEQLERRSSKGDAKIKRFWSITLHGLRYGKNETSPASPNETQPRWYVDRFGELLAEVEAYRPALRVVAGQPQESAR